MINLDNFIKEKVIKRNQSMFLEDITDNRSQIEKNIEDKSVLVIGGAGSIGSSFIKSILPYKPKCLCVIDINENGLAELTRDLRSSGSFIPERYMTYPIDYASPILKKIYKKNNGFQIVANFSAHKHVRSEKDIFSIEALFRNNIINAKILLDLLITDSPEAYFCVSTDKASNPVSLMGASKRIMEDLVFSYSDYFPVKTARFASCSSSSNLYKPYIWTFWVLCICWQKFCGEYKCQKYY